ncbi:hypothetical protein GCM10010914_30040 [Deinococcus wulumuqiensis]|uniref:Uncharacterized protein n=1 Tax=Deinococcus wulumuqiensis TaxID=980427 RepID=A0AAV4KAZ5_9DEIO|nr:hypothetical protein GCM10010914_30040 [Deinococcus wulumuqiensis]GGP31254.1 hypothetical protein GCM10008021_29050 [Deinococcus wulumuqiensis]
MVQVRVREDHRCGWMLTQQTELRQGGVAEGAGARASVDQQVAFLQEVQVTAGTDLIGASQAIQTPDSCDQSGR